MTRLIAATLVVLSILVLATSMPASPVGGGACCTFDSCFNVADEDECNALGGVLLPGEDCATDPCAVGACCVELNCNQADAFSCITAGRIFAGAGTSCFDDPCKDNVGACCFSDGTCQDLSPDDCNVAGATWLGAGTNCGTAPCTLGACCLVQDCQNLAQHECDELGGTLIPGVDCATQPCLRECPVDTLFGQERNDPDDFIAGTSELSAGFKRYEHFFSVGGAITGLKFWGLDLDNVGGNNFVECVETDPTFNISFHEDAAGVPGAVVCSYTIVATRTPTGIFYLGAELNVYDAELKGPCVLTNGWVSIEGLGDPECWFLWMSSAVVGGASSWCEGCQAELQDFDLAVCLTGDAGGIFGACCDDATGQCTSNVEITDCEDADLRFVPDTDCNDLDPPCGVFLGACCFDDAVCSIETEEDCGTIGGSWLGENTICDSCPCTVACPPGSTQEGEPVCFPGYDDQFNGGCDTPVESFRRIDLGETVCGISGVFEEGLDTVPDTDWYEVVMTEAGDLQWSGLAEFPAAMWIYNSNDGCGTEQELAFVADFECEPMSRTVSVGPGIYWLKISPIAFSDESNCGTGYRVTAKLACPADFDGNGVVDTVDFLFLLAAWGMPEGDLNGNGTTDTVDFLLLLAAWGDCPD